MDGVAFGYLSGFLTLGLFFRIESAHGSQIMA
jgi:hypothetical protein